jgi:DNA-binding NarL/FixJ family response regulator
VRTDGLTDRELQIALLVTQGKTDKAIAAHLHIDPQTVRWHVHRIAERWGFAKDAETNIRVCIANRVQKLVA